jgi:hypothetical protein
MSVFPSGYQLPWQSLYQVTRGPKSSTPPIQLLSHAIAQHVGKAGPVAVGSSVRSCGHGQLLQVFDALTVQRL